jgi:hypothetical protein
MVIDILLPPHRELGFELRRRRTGRLAGRWYSSLYAYAKAPFTVSLTVLDADVADAPAEMALL